MSKLQVPTSEKWRAINKPIKTIFGLNPLLIGIFLMTIFLMHIWTLALCIFLTVFFSIVEYKGVSAFMALRWIRTQLTCSKKLINPWWIK